MSDPVKITIQLGDKTIELTQEELDLLLSMFQNKGKKEVVHVFHPNIVITNPIPQYFPNYIPNWNPQFPQITCQNK